MNSQSRQSSDRSVVAVFCSASTATTLSAASWARAAGSNSRMGVAMVGCGIRGHEVMSRILATDRAELRCICDVYDEHRGKRPRIVGARGRRRSRRRPSKRRSRIPASMPSCWRCPTICT